MSRGCPDALVVLPNNSTSPERPQNADFLITSHDNSSSPGPTQSTPQIEQTVPDRARGKRDTLSVPLGPKHDSVESPV